ncbi:M15 family metallopeptidase [Lachnoanaerobaculum sp. OBRC5-5]|uniref:M15 family metallopeptidase n=1 Tax=Lachnoanaerobaculum sp. OBRC5-5 TaxID=936595 RepID=UPI0002824AB5|nr:M15 family metallopeptidase [Lachnoanaerobaculum sp. OBRC5-5]EJZ69171.1 hypothetical protein HMPREF1135_02395 [Lachnoanaerobaculum sp. OBRC5-5]
MKSSVKINNRVDMSGKSVSFSTKEKANRIPVKSLDRRKFNMNKMAKNALGSIPSCVLVTGSSEQRAEMEILKMVQGSIPVVIGSLTKTELKKSGEKTMGIKDINYVMYHDTTGVRTAAKAASGNKNSVLSNINKSERNGWVKTEIGWMYNENGKPVTGWKLIDGKWYYFESTGVMQTGWRTISGKIYYFHSKGDMAESEWIQDKTNKNWYYIKSNGEIAKSEWRQDSVGKWYYVRSNGQMVKSEWRQDSAGKWYYLGSNGEMVTSQMVKGADGKNYYLGEDGAMVVNKDITWEGTTYHVDGNGVCTKKRNNTGHNVSDIHPKLKILQKKLIEECESKGLLIRITQEIRTAEEQDRLYAQGRTTSGNIVTNARGSDYSSHHQWGTAFDFCRNDGNDPYYDKDGFFSKVGAIGKSIGLEWGGDWKKPVDKPHFQLPDWGSTTKELKQQYGTPDEFEKTWN